MRNRFVSLLEQEFGSEISNWCNDYANKNISKVAKRKAHEVLPSSLRVDKINVSKVVNAEMNSNGINLRLIVVAVINAGYRREYKQWFDLKCELTLLGNEKSMIINDICVYDSLKVTRNEYDIQVSKDFIPLISRGELEIEATRFLEKHCPSALVTPMAVPVREIAVSMGLDVLEGFEVKAERKIFGAVCFENCSLDLIDAEGEISNVDLNKGTIIIDKKTFFWGNIGCVNNTIAHELYHWHRHRLYAVISNMTKENKVKVIAACRCPRDPKKGMMLANLKITDNDWMEWQANSVAPRILMPFDMAQRVLKRLLQEYKYDTLVSVENRRKVLQRTIYEFAKFFDVSVQSAMIRLVELGMSEAEDVFNEQATANISYEIELTNFYSEYQNNIQLKTAVDEQQVLYVTNRCVYNNVKYLYEGQLGELKLTEYALSHVSEACVGFTEEVYVGNRNIEKLTSMFFRGLDQSYVKWKRVTEKLFDEPENKKYKIESNLQRANLNQFDKNLLAKITDDFVESMNNIFNYIIIDEMGIVKNKLRSTIEDRTGINSKNLSYMNNGERVTKERILAIGIGLGLGLQVTEKLLHTVGLCLTNSNDDYDYKLILTTFRDKNIYDIDEFLENRGMKRLVLM